jgi:hypothetical protein
MYGKVPAVADEPLARGAGLVVGCVDQARETEVADPDLAEPCDQHVVGLEVAMHQAGAMDSGEPTPGVHQRGEHRGRRPRRRRPRAQGRSLDELHRDVGVTARFTHVVDRDDVGVAQARECPPLA